MLGALTFAIFGIIEFLVGFRFVFLLFGANPSAPFVSFIYAWSQPFVAPFEGIFNQHVVISVPGVVVHSVLDWTALIALVVYMLIGGVLGRILSSL